MLMLSLYGSFLFIVRLSLTYMSPFFFLHADIISSKKKLPYVDLQIELD